MNKILDSLPEDVFTLVISCLSDNNPFGVAILSMTCKKYTYLSSELSYIWEKNIPDHFSDSWTTRIEDQTKLKISMTNIALIDGHKTKWMMYKYITERQKINSVSSDLKIMNTIINDQSWHINRLKNEEIKNKSKEYGMQLSSYRNKVYGEIENKKFWLENDFKKLSNIGKRIRKENEESWKNIKTRIIFGAIFRFIKNNNYCIYKSQLVKIIYKESKGKYNTCGLGNKKSSDILICSKSLKINKKYIDKMEQIVKDQYNKNNKSFVWTSTSWYIKWVKDYDEDIIYLT